MRAQVKQINFNTLIFCCVAVVSLCLGEPAHAVKSAGGGRDRGCAEILVSETDLFFSDAPLSPEGDRRFRDFHSSKPVTIDGQHWMAFTRYDGKIDLFKLDAKLIESSQAIYWRSGPKLAGSYPRSPTSSIQSSGQVVLIRSLSGAFLYRAQRVEGGIRLEKIYEARGLYGSLELLDLSADGTRILTSTPGLNSGSAEIQLRRTDKPNEVIYRFSLPSLDNGLGISGLFFQAHFFFDEDRMIAISQGADVRFFEDSSGMDESTHYYPRVQLMVLTDTLQPLYSKIFEGSGTRKIDSHIYPSPDRQSLLMPNQGRRFDSILNETQYKPSLPSISFKGLRLEDLASASERDALKAALMEPRRIADLIPGAASALKPSRLAKIWKTIVGAPPQEKSATPAFEELYSAYLQHKYAAHFETQAESSDGSKVALYIPFLNAFVIWDTRNRKVLGTLFPSVSKTAPHELFGLRTYFSEDGHSLWLENWNPGVDLDLSPFRSNRFNPGTGLTLWNFESPYSK